MKKCELCGDNTECIHVYNHDNEDNLFCNSCNGICKLSRKSHLCNMKHDCKEICQKNGYCRIDAIMEPIEKTYKTKLGDEIKYKSIVKRNLLKVKCYKKIPNNEFSHDGEHVCVENLIHKCGYECIQCGFNCYKEYGHGGLHECEHGNIQNSSFSIIGSFNIATVQISGKSYQIIEGDSAQAYVCNNYCREQGQGHTHLVNSSKVNIINKDVKKFNDNYYECKCSYFWEYILKFQTNFTPEEKKKFSLCNTICQDDKHKEYCQRELWHGSDIPNNLNKIGRSCFQGHMFKCDHPNGVYTIFLVDQSGSMRSESVKPKRTDIKNKMDNMLGSSIEVILNYCKKRFAINPREMCALIGYSDDVSLIFKDISIGEEEKIKNYCLTRLSPDGGTYFKKAFEAAKNIVEEINKKKEYIPVIILLTDGLDFEPEETINYIEKEVSYIYYNFNKIILI